MRTLSKNKAKKMCRALDKALKLVRCDDSTGLCMALFDCELNAEDTDYLQEWIRQMLGDFAFLENASFRSIWKFSAEERYEHRKPWVKWMKQHLMETSG